MSPTSHIPLTPCSILPFFFFSSRRRHTRCSRDWSSDVCSSDLPQHRALCCLSCRHHPPGSRIGELHRPYRIPTFCGIYSSLIFLSIALIFFKADQTLYQKGGPCLQRLSTVIPRPPQVREPA